MNTVSWHHLLINGGRIEPVDAGSTGALFRLVLPPTCASAYADAQLDDYTDASSARRFMHLPPRRMEIRARFSSNVLKGTAGFGFWNNPFTQRGDVVEPPCTVWFFYSSPESDMRVTRSTAGHGFKAAMLNSYPSTHAAVTGTFNLMTKLGRPLLNWMLRRRALAGLVLSAARATVQAREVLLNVDMTAWHIYTLDWQTDQALFMVDGRLVLCAPHPPRKPLGFVAWIDNYRATASGGTRAYEFAYVDVQQEQWMEVEIRQRW
ncbi:MAG: hypothetical protein RMN25_13100 [Anaerolineae bacterium]|nr:hypothetical protein [Thermoflexales bacterium]MDW8408710.1 hypothetical protein [Anaerolineae bacterium]